MRKLQNETGAETTVTKVPWPQSSEDSTPQKEPGEDHLSRGEVCDVKTCPLYKADVTTV